jgi:hypothetical protein
MAPPFVTAEDRENYGSELVDFSKRAALEALTPELQQLRAENQQLRHQQQRAQHLEIERQLDRSVPDWRDIYADSRFSQWLAEPDELSGTTRSQLLRNAVANGDVARVVRFYSGFQQEAGQPPLTGGQRSRQGATGAKRIYSREDIRRFYEQRRLGAIPDAKWGPIEADIVAAGREGRIVGAIGPDGTAMSRWR